MSRLKEAVFAETEKVFTAFVSWGIGILIMVAYCLFIYWLNQSFGKYVMVMGAMLFLAVAFFFIDLWWGYHKVKEISE
ncbi:MAG: hypothetical protein CVU89_12740 [Firmicutes bacterium HGW-Firmicutes-14]|jgi:hypothetical protein|nr:MAG: hypothetical protein CVU89_12740 [Firmicutes bacterium HGW-Firmicutes-14]